MPSPGGDATRPPFPEDLAAQFRCGLQERIATLLAASESLAADPAARSRVRSVAHALKGAGGTYGYPEITTAAAAVESCSDEAIATDLVALLEVLRTVVGPTGGTDSGTLPDATVETQPADVRSAPLRRATPREGAAAPRARLLIVDDDPDIVRVLQRALASPEREIEVADSAATMDRLVARHAYDLIVLDLLLPDADGRTLLAELKLEPRTAGIPVIVLSALGSETAKAECFALGADAYVEKPFDLIVVAAAVASRLERTRHVRPDARTDPDTLLPSRAAFNEAFERATGPDAATTGAGPVAVALFELDQHAALASASGWASGARALSVAGRALTKALEGASLVALWSGATIAALLPGQAEADATAAVERALAAIRDLAAETPAERHTFSAGVIAWQPGRSLGETVADAEQLVLAAKAAGGDKVRSASHTGAAPSQTILLAEDDDLIASVVKHRLGREGMTVEHFPDGLTALEAAPRVRPALAILDVKMPGMDGFELLARLRAQRDFERVPILMLTSMGSEHDIVRGLGLGADEYMVKPFSPVELVARVRRLLARR